MFKNRRDAAGTLSTKLMDLYNREALLVVGISLGGMVIANEVAKQLNAPSDYLTVRKLRVPDNQTEPMGAIAIGGETVYNKGIIDYFKVSHDIVEQSEIEEHAMLDTEDIYFRGDNTPFIDVAGKTVLLVDDGMSTGVTMRASIDAMKAQGAGEIIVASPVSSTQVCMMFKGIADRTVCYATPQPFQSVENWYEDFEKPSHDEARDLIREGRAVLA